MEAAGTISALEHIAQTLRGRQLTDIVVPGYIDGPAGRRSFRPMFDEVYFDFDGILLRAASTHTFSRLSLTLVQAVTCNFDIDPDDEFGVSSIDFILRSPDAPTHLQQIIAFVEAEAPTPDPPVCAALSFTRDVVFLDPRNIFGVHVGTREALTEWREYNAAEASPMLEISFQ